ADEIALLQLGRPLPIRVPGLRRRGDRLLRAWHGRPPCLPRYVEQRDRCHSLGARGARCGTPPQREMGRRGTFASRIVDARRRAIGVGATGPELSWYGDTRRRELS